MASHAVWSLWAMSGLRVNRARLLTCALAFVPVERSRVGLFAPLRDKVTSSAQSPVPFRSGQPRRSGLSILTELHDELALVHSITKSAAIRGTALMERGPPVEFTPA
jgi:hypothetical protein